MTPLLLGLAWGCMSSGPDTSGDRFSDLRVLFPDLRTGVPSGPPPARAALSADPSALLLGSLDRFHVAGEAWDATSPIATDRGSAWLVATPGGGPPWRVYGAPGGCRRWGADGGLARASTVGVSARLSDPAGSWPLSWSTELGMLRADPLPYGLADSVTLTVERDGAAATLALRGPGNSFLVREPYFQRHDRELARFDPAVPVRIEPGSEWDALVVVVARPAAGGGWDDAVSCVVEAGTPPEVTVDPGLVAGWPTGAPVHLLVGRANRAKADGIDVMRVFWLVGQVALAAP